MHVYQWVLINISLPLIDKFFRATLQLGINKSIFISSAPDKHDTFNKACMLKGTHRANLFKWIRMAQEEKSSHSPTTDTFIIVVPFSQIINFVLSDSDMSLCVRLAFGSFSAASFFRTALGCVPFMPAFGLKFIISHSPCLCRKFFFARKHVFFFAGNLCYFYFSLG